MPKLAFVTSPAHRFQTSELVKTLRYELAEQDVPSTLSTEFFSAPAVDVVYVLVDPDDFLASAGPDSFPPADVLRRTIFLSASRAPSGAQAPHLEHYQQAGVVFDIDPDRVAARQKAGIAARHLRLGYSPKWDHFDPAARPTIDVMFLGRDSPHRAWQLNRCARLLADRSCRIHLVGSGELSGEAKWDLLTKTRIVLNIHAVPGAGYHRLEWARILDAIHAGAAVVSEHATDLRPLVPGEHLLTAGPEAFPYVLEAALADADLCRRLRQAAYERIRDWLPFSLAVAGFRAAAVDLVGRPALSS